MRVEGIDPLIQQITQVTQKASRGVFAEMQDAGVRIQELARRMAPLEFGSLESSIKVEVVGGGRDASGRFSRKEVIIYVDESEPVEGRPGHTIGEYALYMHEGAYNLGPQSEAKQMSEGVEVGPKFLERAADEVERDLPQKLNAAAQAAL